MSLHRASKANQKVHRERSQLSSRSHLGFLEKKKDYKERAENFQQKERKLKALRIKAEQRNPDEFYFKMVNTRLKDGVHQKEDKTPKYTDDQLKLMSTQDIKYINYKRSKELKKIERLKSSLHMLDAPDKPKNKHIIFVDSKKQAKEFDAAKHLDTDPSLLGRAYNRPRKSQMVEAAEYELNGETLKKLEHERQKQYKELNKRQHRERQLRITASKMATKASMKDKRSKKVLVHKETVDHAAQYKWAPCRQR